jgi:hypothetical protein
MQQRDYIERLIAELAAMIASALGAGKQGRVLEAQQELDEAWIRSVGLHRADAERLDDATLRATLGAKAALAARLFDAQAELEEAREAAGTARPSALRRRAAALRG